MLSEFVKSADWKTEKHVPVICCDDTASPDDCLKIQVCIGKEVKHPNTTNHHIAWIALHYVPEGATTSIELTRCEFSAHAASAEGPDTGPALTCSNVTVCVNLKKSGTLYATAYCNIHGLWSSEKIVTVA